MFLCYLMHTLYGYLVTSLCSMMGMLILPTRCKRNFSHSWTFILLFGFWRIENQKTNNVKNVVRIRSHQIRSINKYLWTNDVVGVYFSPKYTYQVQIGSIIYLDFLWKINMYLNEVDTHKFANLYPIYNFMHM
jgi:hypothetical protein